MNGLIILDKPAGISSMTAVAAVRRRAGGVRTGHAGTLDPLATGVLVIAVGAAATRSIDQIMRTDKHYETEIDLSAFTTTDDREGERMKQGLGVSDQGLGADGATSNPQPLTPNPSASAIRAALARFTGRIMQRPPAFSAMKVGGKRAYKLARKGQAVEIPPREVLVHELKLLDYRWPLARLSIHCGKGFYVRSLARDLGAALGTGGHCASIRRTAVGPFTLAMARRLDELPEHIQPRDLLLIEAALRMVQGGAGESESARH